MTMARGKCVAVLGACVLLFAAGIATADLVNGLRAHYEFEGTGQTVPDSTSNNLDGYLGASTGAYPNTDPDRVAGLIGQALDFTPAPPETYMDMVTLPGSNQFITGASAPVTIAAWIDPDSIGSASYAHRIFTLYRDTGAASTGFSLALGSSTDGGATGKLCFARNTGSAFVTTPGNTTLSTSDGWHHAAITYSGMNATLYVDGKWDRTITTSCATTSTGTARIGAFDTDNQGFDGKIDDVGVWTRPLTAAEIQAVYSAGRQGTTLSDAASPPPAPLALYYKLDESTGTTAEDSSGNANHGTLNGGLSFPNDSVTGEFGTALDFDGSNDYINVANAAGLPATGDDFTVTTWLNVSEWDDNRLIASSSVNGIKWNLGMHYHEDGVLSASTSFGSNTAYAIDTSGLPDDEFVHVAVVYTATAGVADMFVNGQPVAETTNSGCWTPNDPDITFAIGRRFHHTYGPNHFNGAMDEFAIFNRVLTPQEINAVMNFGVESYYIPEPTTLILLGAGLAAAALRRRRRS